MTPVFIRWFEDIGAGDTGSVGGKNASLGEMVRNLGCYDIKVPTGFATTAEGYRHFLVANNLGPVIASSLAELKGGTASVAEVGSAIRAAILKAGVPGGSRGSYWQPTGICRSAWEWMKLTWQYAQALRPRTCPRPVLLVSRKASSTSAARPRWLCLASAALRSMSKRLRSLSKKLRRSSEVE